MPKSSLARKTLSTFVATTLVVSLNAPVAAWAGDGASGDAAAEQTQFGTTAAGASAAANDGTAQAGEAVQGGASFDSSEGNKATVETTSVEGEAAIATVSLGGDTSDDDTSDGDASEYAASVGDESYINLSDAIAAATSGQTVKLLKDVKDNLVVAAGKSIVLDLNDHSISAAETGTETSTMTGVAVSVAKGAELTVNDTGANKKGAIVCSSDSSEVISNAGTVTLNGGTFSGGNVVVGNDSYQAQATVNDGVAICASSSGYGIYSTYNSTLTINGGTFSGGLFAVFSETPDTTVTPKVYINGGTFKGSSSAAVHASAGTLAIAGGSFSAEEGACAVVSTAPETGASVTATISGGTFAANSNSVVLENGYKLDITGGTFAAAVDVVAILNNASTGTVTIKDAVFESTGTATQLINNAGAITIESGKFTAADASTAMITNAGSGTVTAKGGTYSGDISSSCTLDSGDYSVVKGSDGVYVVVKKLSGTRTDDGIDAKDFHYEVRPALSDGVSMDEAERKQVCALLGKAAVALHEQTFSGETTATSEILGDFTLDLSDSSVRAAYDEVKNNASNNKWHVRENITLVVRTDTYVSVNEKIAAEAEQMNASGVVPFTQSVDMVIEVRDTTDGSDGTYLTSATIPVAKIGSSITTTVSVAADKIKAKLDVAHCASDGSVSTAKPDSVNYDTGAVTFTASDFSTPDFACIATATPHADLADYTDADGSRKSVVNSDFGYDNSYAFAGWCKDPYCKTACSTTDTSGTVFPKFVKTADLITFKGGSLRMDQEASVATSLRFGYETRVPEGAKLDGITWDYGIKGSSTTHNATMVNYVVNSNSITANLVLTGAAPASYGTAICVSENATYTTVDGTSVTATETTSNERSIVGVAQSILKSGYALEADKTYANAVIAAAAQQ